MPTATGRLAALALASLSATLVVGCGDSAVDPVERFVGTWRYVDGTGSATCPMGDPIAENPTGNKTFERGVNYDLIDLTQLAFNGSIYGSIYCDFHFDVMGPTATATPGQDCALAGGDLLTLKSWTFSLNPPTGPDDYPAEELAMADINTVAAGSTPAMTCQYQLTAHLQRITKN